jgi:hypothetical protein
LVFTEVAVAEPNENGDAVGAVVVAVGPNENG